MPDSASDSVLAQLFTRQDLAGSVSWFSIPGGQTLFESGERADQLFLLRTGRLAAIRRDEGQEPRFLGVIRPGEPAGEMAMISGAAHTAAVVAIRDSEILAISRETFFAAVAQDPAVMIELARLMILRARQASGGAAVGAPSVFGFVAAQSGVDVRALVEGIGAEIEALGFSVVTAGEEVLRAPTEWFTNVEQANDFVLYAAEIDEHAWKHLVSRQVDRLFRIGLGSAPPPLNLDLSGAEPLRNQALIDLILLQPSDIKRPLGAEAWIDRIRPARLFHLREHHLGDTQRIARILTGTSVGLVLSGGGARAYAHVGAIRALRSSGLPIDFVGGSSMGAIVAAAVAMGWEDDEIDLRIRKAFVDSSPVDDVALPLLAMTRGEKVGKRLYENFGEQQIADLWLPFFSIASNLTSGSYQVDRRGGLCQALRASIAIPGLLPPVIQGEDVLVDGAVMKNLPTDVMRAMHLGPVVGVDVTVGRSITASDVAKPASVWRWLLSGDWRKGPPMVSLLLRAATVSTARDLKASREATDLLVLPQMENVEIRDWRAYDRAVEAGRRGMEKALSRLSRPLTDMRRRASLLDAPVKKP